MIRQIGRVTKALTGIKYVCYLLMGLLTAKWAKTKNNVNFHLVGKYSTWYLGLRIGLSKRF